MILITGAAGFIGSRIACKLNQTGRTDLVLVDQLGCNEKWKNLRELVYEDYLEKGDLFVYLDGLSDIEAVIHMGACSSTTEKNASYLIQNNYRYTRRLAEWCLKHGARFIYASSAATYGDGNNGYGDNLEKLNKLQPLNMYGYSKHLFDQVAHQKGWLSQIVGLKFFNVYGPNEDHKGEMSSVVYKGFHQVEKTGKIMLFKSHREDYSDGGQLRDFIYVKDVEDVVVHLLKHPEINGLFNLGTGQARSFEDLATAVFTAMNRQVNIEYIDMPDHLRDRYQYFTQAEMQKLAQTGVETKFRSLEEGIGDYIVNHLCSN
ncbi:MAG: ADP-glyceromanno-heptose 6-epimerase [Acidobacteria bacterium]|nr:MAG: ADP-glyceromanno-heptose 6-epimerase [Acidobacteriota bacterium]